MKTRFFGFRDYRVHWSTLDLPVQDDDPEHKQNGVDRAKSGDRTENLATGYDGARTVCSSKPEILVVLGMPVSTQDECTLPWLPGPSGRRVYSPGLATHFCSHPAGLVGDNRCQNGKNKSPHQPPTVEQGLFPIQPAAQDGDAEEEAASSQHQTPGNEWNKDRRPVSGRKLVETNYGLRKTVEQEKAETSGDRNSCIHAILSRNTEQCFVAPASRELALEGGQLCRLGAVDVSRLRVPADHDGNA